eukprot:g8066.t1
MQIVGGFKEIEATEAAPEVDVSPEDVAKMTYGEFNNELNKACREDDFAKYRALWDYVSPVRIDNQAFDDALLADGCIKNLKYAFRHTDSIWRETGVRVSRTFFHNQEAREKLVLLDFPGSMMVLTMPKDGAGIVNIMMKPSNPALHEQWARNISAMAHCAHSMGTMIKYDHPCQVDLVTVGTIFASMSDNLRLVSELSRLFYWICRKSQDLFETLVQSAPGGNMEGLDTLLYSLVATWKQSVDLHQRLASAGSAAGRNLKCYNLKQEQVQQCHELMVFFGEQLLTFLDLAIIGKGLLRLLLDGVSILSLQRDMQTLLANFNIWGKLNRLVRKYRDRNSNRDHRKIELAVLRVMSQVAIHPAHRLGWVAKELEPDEVYPPREEFEDQLESWIKRKDESLGFVRDFCFFKLNLRHCKTIASLLLNLFEEQKFQRDPSKVETTLLSIFDWWQVNSTTGYEQDQEAKCEGRSVRTDEEETSRLVQHFAKWRKWS